MPKRACVMRIQIIGARGKIQNLEETLEKVENFANENNVVIQLLNAEMVFSKKHLFSAVLHAIRAFKKRNKKLGIEILLYASCERQISKAFEKIGIKEGNKEIAIIIIGECDTNNLLNVLELKRDENVLNGNISILKNFGISGYEIDIVEGKGEHLLLERIALLDIIK